MIRLKNLLDQSRIFSQPLIVGVCAFVFSTSVFANPVLDNVAAGQVTIQQETNSTVINQSSQQAIVNWQSFNIGAQESTHFQQPAGGVALNRINPSQGVSEIYGRLTATGQIILVNPAGIFFGPGSYVNVGGLVASTANISNEDFLNNYYHFANDGTYNGAIVNQGQIFAAEHGLVALVGGAVSNEGYIQANMGHAVLASGNSFTMSFAGNDLIGFSVDSGIAQRAQDKNGNESSVGVSNTGSIIANGGRILISAKDAAGVLDKVINMQGIAQTLSVSDGANKHDGEIILIGDEQRGTVEISGKLIASGNSADNKGGNVSVTGHNILLTSSADIDVSGNAGGGNINIGGNYQGQGPLPNAKAVVMLAHANINADANSAGDGGHVIIWSNNYTNVNGSISARGGSVNGNGGFIETSSKDILNIGDLTVNTNAANGLTGTWLLDPYDVFITSSADSGGSFNGSNPNVFTPSATANILNTTLNTNLNNANVTITTTGAGGDAGNISVNAPITWSSGNTLLLQATNNIYLNADITALNGGLSLSAVNSSQSITSGTPGSPSATGVTANINVGNFNLLQGQWYQVNSTLPTFNVTNSFTLMNDAVFNASNPAFYATDLFLRVKGGDGTTGNPYQLADIYGLQGLNSGAPGEMMYANFILANDIDATGTRTWNNGAGFHPIGSFYVWNASYSYNGVFDGNYHTIDGLHINRAQDDSTAKMGAALFGSTWAPTIRNLGLTNVDITSQNNRAAGLVAFASWQSYWTSPRASFSNIYVTGNVTSGAGFAGGIVGYLGDGTISNSYNAATVTGYGSGSAIGGVVGYVANGNTYGQVTNVYNIGAVRNLGTGNAGGIAGVMQSGTTELSYSYNSGSVLTANGIAGGLVAENYGTNVAGNFWDTDTSGTTLSVATGSSVGTGGCFSGTCTNGGTANLSSALTYSNAGWSIASTGFTGTTPPALVNWLILDTQTRPMLRSEWHPSIKTAHQLQLMSTALGESYELANDIDLASALTNASDVWGTNYNTPSGAGFVPIGTSTTQFTGNFDGLNNAIDHLYINRPSSDYVGLFSYIYVGTATNFTLSNPTVTGNNYVGGAVGGISFQGSAYIQNVHVSNGSVSGVNSVGGLLGVATGSGVFNSSSSANVYGTAIGSGAIGGLVGNVNSGFSAVIQNSFSTGNVYAPDNSSSIGGLVGFYWSEPLSDSYSTGNVVSGNNSSLVGGLIGWGLMSATNAYSTGSVTVGTGSSGIGGLFGAQQAGLISSSYSSGAVTAGTGSSDVGGLVGRSASDAAFSNNYSVSSVTAPNSSVVGGFMGRNDGAPISNAYSSGYINAPGSSNVGGLMGVLTGNLSNSFWDVDTSGYANPFGTNSGTATNVYGGCFTGTCTNTGSVNASYLFGGTTAANLSSVATYTTTLTGEGGSAWSIASSGFTGAAPPSVDWLILNGSTRPMLRSEWSTSIKTPHQVQLMSTAQAASYTLANDIDLGTPLANTSEVWGASTAGFVPVSAFTGSLNGQNHVISGLRINQAYYGFNIGLFSTISAAASISNLGLSNVNIYGGSSVGSIAGTNNGTILNSYSANGSVIATSNIGGIAGYNTGTIDDAYFSGVNSNLSGASNQGGIAGYNDGTITNSYNLGSVITFSNGWGDKFGGIAGINGSSGVIENSYNAGTVAGGGDATHQGGITSINYGLISNSYNVGPVYATQHRGGIAGVNEATGVIENSYNSGYVSATSPYPGWSHGGLVGVNNGGLNNSFWDIDTSGQLTPTGSGAGSISSIFAGCFSGTCTTSLGSINSSYLFSGTTAANLSAKASYTTTLASNGGTAWDIANTPSTTSIAPTNTWYIFDNNTRPMLMMEQQENITNAHQLQMMGTTLGASYTLANNINLATPLSNTADVWGGSSTGFVPVGNNTHNYSGVFSGQNYTISNLKIGVNQNYIGLFGATSYVATLKDLTLNNVNIATGTSYMGALVGQNAGQISNVTASGNFSGLASTNYIGGITGYNTSTGIITLANSSVTIPGIWPINPNYVGGIAGQNNGNISDSANSGQITARDLVGGITGNNTGFISNSNNSGIMYAYSNVAGITGSNSGYITNSYNTGSVTGDIYGNTIAGIAAINTTTGHILRTFNTGTIFSIIYSNNAGGIVAANSGEIGYSYNQGLVNGQAFNGPGGGIAGINNATGTIHNSYNTGYIFFSAASYGGSGYGGIVGNNAGAINNSYSIGAVTPASSYFAGFVGVNEATGTIANGYWDTTTSGATLSSTGYGYNNNATVGAVTLTPGTFNSGVVDLAQSASFSGFDFTNIWNIIPGKSYPYLRAFYSSTPRIVSGTSTATVNTDMTISVDATVVDTTKTFANGFFYRLYGLNNITGINDNPADGSALLLYQNSTPSVGNVVTNLPSSNGSLSGTTGLTLIANTLTVGSAGISINLNNAALGTAKGSLVDSAILYSVSGNNLTINAGRNFATTSNTTYTLDGNISATGTNNTNGNITFAGPLVLSGANRSLTTNTFGNVNISNTVNGGGFGFTVSNAGSSSLISGIMSNMTTFTKAGSGTLTLSADNDYGSGASTIINGGILAISDDNNLGVVPGSPDFDNIRFSNNGILQIANSLEININRGIYMDTGGGTIQVAAGTLTYDGIVTGGTGDLTLDGPGNFTRNTNLTTPAALTVNANIGTFTFDGTAITTAAGSLNLNGAITLTNNNNITLSALGAGSDLVFSGTTLGGGYTNTLTLSAADQLNINGPVAISAGKLSLSAADSAQSIETNANGTINVYDFDITTGHWYQVGALPAFTVSNNFQINSGVMPAPDASFIRATSGNGIGTPYVLVDVYGLQGMGSGVTTVTQNFNLGNNIDASTASNWNSDAGFVPIGSAVSPFTGNFNGQNYSINNLYISRSNATDVGLFGNTFGGALQNVGVTNATIAITGTGNNIGILAGNSSSSIDAVHTSGTITVSGAGTDVGGAVGALPSGGVSITNSNSASSITVGNNSSSIGGFAGGTNWGSASNSYATGNITVVGNGSGIAGFIAGSNLNLTDVHSTGNILITGNGSYVGGLTATTIGGFAYTNTYSTSNISIGGNGDRVGGLLAWSNWTNNTNQGTLNSYSSGNINIVGAGTYVGGLIGESNSNSVNSYSISNITAGANSSNIGGLTGAFINGVNIDMNYSSGRIIAGRNSTNVAGFIGSIDSGGGNTITNSFWDTDSSLQRTGVAAGSNTGVTGGCFSGTCTNGGTVNLSDITTYSNAGWDITSTPTLTGSAPGNAWFIFDDSTRPLLTMEHETNISNAHQLQMMGAALGGSYTLANNIDLTNTLTNTSDVWGTNYNTSTGSGFAPIGAGSVATAFQGTFNGQNFVINNLYINRPLTNFVGLFGANIGSGTTISNLGLTNVNVTGLSAVGGLLGQNSNSGAAGFVGGTLPAEVGNISSNITNVYVTGNVTGSGALIGGLIGYNSAGTLSNAYSTANVTATGGILALAGFTGTGVGGLTGSNGGNITTSYASGNVSATQASSLVGGLTGYHIFGSISQSYSNNLITAANGSSSVGGFVGNTTGSSGGGATNTISNSYSTSRIITSSSSSVGGFVGATSTQGGAPIISNAYSSGSITGTGNTDTGGFGGSYIAGSVTSNNFWDAENSGIATDPRLGSGVDDLTTAEMMQSANFTGWTFGGTAPIAGSATPGGTWLILDGSTRPMLTMEWDTDIVTPHQLQLMNFALGANYQLTNNVDLTAGLTNTSDVWATNYNTATGTGFIPVGYIADVEITQWTPEGTEFTGTFNGNGYNINNLYIDNPTGMTTFGLFGATTDNVTIQNVGLTNVNIFGSNIIGGLIGYMIGNGTAMVSNTFVTGAITSNVAPSSFYAIGGLIGKAAPSSAGNFTIQNSYSIASVSATDNQTASGFIGLAQEAFSSPGGTINITNNYSSGSVSVGSGEVSGFAYLRAGAIVTNNFWDVESSGLTIGYSSSVSYPTINGLYAGCFAGGGTCATQTITNATLDGNITPKDLSLLATYTTGGPTWDITSTPSETALAPNNAWFIFDGNTRPMLMMENKSEITNAHQLQMMGAALGANYQLGNNIDFNTINSAADVWGTNINAADPNNPYAYPTTYGFAPVGNTTYNFNGSFNGNGYAINKLFVMTPSFTNVGLFGVTGSAANIKNVYMTNPIVSGNNVGSIVGNNSGIISDSRTTSIYGSYGWIGGGLQVTGVDVRGSTAGGIAGYNAALIFNVVDNLHLFGASLGGLAGANSGTIMNSYSTGSSFDGGNSQAGGLIGVNQANGQLLNSFYTGSVSTGYYSVYYGGLVANNAGLISNSYNAGNLYPGFGNSWFGGIAGYNAPTGLIENSYNTGNIVFGQGSNGLHGGVVGYNDGTITHSYSIGTTYYQHDPGGATSNGFVGQNVGTINDSFWDIGTSGYARGYGANSGTINGLYGGCLGGTNCNLEAITNATNAGSTPVDLSQAGTYANWDTTNIWNIIPDQSYPYLRAFYSNAPRAISGTHPSGSRFNAVSLAVNGSVFDSTSTYYNGGFYFLEGYNNISKIDKSINDYAGIVVYSTSGSLSNYVTYAPVNGASLSVSNSILLANNTITASTSETNIGLITPLSSSQIAGAINGLSSPYLLLSNSGNDVSIADGYNFTIATSTPYVLDGNITLTNGTLTINSPLTITTPNPVLMTNTSGDIILNNTVAGGGNALTINTAGTNSSVSGVMSNLTNVTKTGSGTLIFTGNNNYAGTTTISGGILQIGNNGTTGSLGTGVVNNDASLVFKRSNAVTIGNSVSGAGSLTQAGSNTLTLSGTNTYTGLTYVDSGRLNVSNSLGFGDGINNTAGVIVADGGQLELLNVSLVHNPTLTLNGAGSDGKGALYHLVGNIVFAGNIALGSDATIGNEVASLSLTGNIDNSGHTLTLDATMGIGISGDISGSGGLIITDAPFNPVVSLSGNNTFTGTTSVLRGILNLASAGALGDGVNNTSSVTVADGAELNIQDINLLAAPTLTLNGTGLFNGGALYAAAGTGTATYNGVINLGSNANIAVSPGATLVLANTGSMTGSGFNLTMTGDGNTTIASSIDTGTGAVIKNGNGSLVLTGDNTYSGGTTINSGILQIGDGVGGSTGLIGTGNITNNGSLIFTVNNYVYVNGNISGTGSLTNTDSYLILTGSNNYSGTTTINSGTLQIGDQGTTGTLGTGDVLNNDELMFSRTDTYTVDNLIDGSGYITMNGANGTLVLNNANSFAGGTSIDNLATIRIGNNDALGSGGVFVAQGTLQAGADGLSISNVITVFNDTTINNNGYTFTLNGEISGSKNTGFLYLNGAGTSIINTNITGPFSIDGVIATTDLVVNGNILTGGDQSYANDVTLTGPAIFDTEGSGTQNITFNGNILGGQDITLQGSGTGTYHFTINGINANNVNVIAAPGSTNNTLTLNSGGAQNFVLTGSNIGSINGIATVANFNFDNIQNLDGGSGGLNSITAANTPNIWNINTNNGGGVTNLDGSFANMQDLIGGTDSDIFNFTDGVSISGTVDGGDQIDDNNHFDFGTIQDSLILTLNMPILNVFDAGVVRTSSSALIVSFSQIQRAIGYGNGFITLPNTPNLKLFADTRPQYANNPKYGAIGDPFYFSNWTIGNPPPPPPSPTTTPAPGNTFNTPIANIVNQPVFNAVVNNNYSPPNTYGYLYDPTVINRTHIEPMLNTTVLKTGSTCYTTSR